MGKPLAIDLYCGLGGWAEGFLAEGYDVVGFDNHRHVYGDQKYPAQLVLQDVTTLIGRQFNNAAVIVASPPCTEYSYMAMPWSRGKQIARALRGKDEFPQPYTGSRTIEDLNRLFDACFRIAKEASEATCHCQCWRCAKGGHCIRCDWFGNTGVVARRIPLVVENVKGAQPWVGEARAHFGSFYLWGDVNSVGNAIVGPSARFGEVLRARKRTGGKANPDGTDHPQGSWFKIADSKNRGSKNGGGSWFAVAHNTESGTGQNPDGRKVPMNFHEFEKTGKPGRSFQSVAVEGVKAPGMNWSKHGEPEYKPQGFNVENARRLREAELIQFAAERYPEALQEAGSKVAGDWFGSYAEQKAAGTISPGRLHGKNSDSRKAASAQIAKIPFPLAQHIAKVFKP